MKFLTRCTCNYVGTVYMYFTFSVINVFIQLSLRFYCFHYFNKLKNILLFGNNLILRNETCKYFPLLLIGMIELTCSSFILSAANSCWKKSQVKINTVRYWCIVLSYLYLAFTVKSFIFVGFYFIDLCFITGMKLNIQQNFLILQYMPVLQKLHVYEYLLQNIIVVL